MPISLTLNRPWKSKVYEQDLAILRSLQPHLQNLYNIHAKLAHLATEYLYAAELAGDCRLLSKREAEVARLLCRRLNIAEIATFLLISPRTVQTHIKSIYEKLRVRSRRQLLQKLLAGNS